MDNNINKPSCFMAGSMPRLSAPGQKPVDAPKMDASKADIFAMPAAGDQVALSSGFGMTPAESAGRIQIAAALSNLDMSSLNPELVSTLSNGNIPMDRESVTSFVKAEFGSAVSAPTAGKIADLAMTKLLADKNQNPSA